MVIISFSHIMLKVKQFVGLRFSAEEFVIHWISTNPGSFKETCYLKNASLYILVFEFNNFILLWSFPVFIQLHKNVIILFTKYFFNF